MSPPESSSDEADSGGRVNSHHSPPPPPPVDALGEALAGMNVSVSGSAVTGPPGLAGAFSLAPGSTQKSNSSSHAIPTNENNKDGWGNFTDPTTAATTSNNNNNNNNSGANTRAVDGNLELFLSQSPSQTLGEDAVFKFSSHQNLPSLAEKASSEEERLGSGTGSASRDASSAFRLQPNGPPGLTSSSKQQQQAFGDMRGARRTESPATAGTTSSSRSGSPNTNNSDMTGCHGSSRGAIAAYHRFETAGLVTSTPATEALSRNASSYAEDDRSSTYSVNNLSHGHGSHPSIATMESSSRSPFPNNKQQPSVRSVGSVSNAGSEALYETSYDGFSSSNLSNLVRTETPQQQPGVVVPGQQQQQQPQVLYMAVPSPDGVGQVLQPVQMVQVGGGGSGANKNYTYMVPGGEAGTLATREAVLDGQSQPQTMTALPPVLGDQRSSSVVDFSSSSSSLATSGASPFHRRGSESNLYAIDNGSRQYETAIMDSEYSSKQQQQSLRSPSIGSQGSSVGSQYQQQQSDATTASLYLTPQRPPLDALLGQVRRLSRDQVGCRLVQQALDEDGPTAATLILNEGLPFWGEAMVDPFGNYLFQKVLEKITPEERIMLIKSVSPRLVNASLNLHGTRSVQKVVELCALDAQRFVPPEGEESSAKVLSDALAPAAARLCIDSHGNHVIQRVLLKLDHVHAKFVFDAVAASVSDVARHRHGCCVIQRCLDSTRSEARSHLVNCIVDKSLELMQDAYGNYVVQYVLDVCSDDYVHAVCESVVGKVCLLAIQKFSSNVMEKCLERCSDHTKELYIQEICDPERIRELMMDPFGNYVVQRALSVATHAQAIRLVEAMRPHLMSNQMPGPHGQRNGGVRNTAGGRRIIAKICRRFPNFTLDGVGVGGAATAVQQQPHYGHIPAQQPLYHQPTVQQQQYLQPQHQQQQQHPFQQQQQQHQQPSYYNFYPGM